jgi:lysophospholipase L1-like esterase
MMSSIRIILAIMLSLVGDIAAAEQVVAPSRWIGRVDEARREFGWPGSGVEIAFDGSFLEIRLADSGKNSLTVILDGKASRLDLRKGENSYRIAEGLAPGPHVVSLSRRTEGTFGNTRFVEAQTDGRFVPAERPQRRLLVIGDSISAGYGVEGKTLGCKSLANAENHYLTYGAIAGRTLDADVTTLAISGIRVTQSDNPDWRPMIELIDRKTQGRRIEDGAPEPVRENFQAVVVNLGTNDFGSGNRPSSFAEDYDALLSKLRRQHPGTPIYAAIGPMLADEDFAAAETAIRKAVDTRNTSGDAGLHYLSLRVSGKGYGCDWHPSPSAHEAVADILVGALQRDLGWDAVQ